MSVILSITCQMKKIIIKYICKSIFYVLTFLFKRALKENTSLYIRTLYVKPTFINFKQNVAEEFNDNSRLVNMVHLYTNI